MMLHYQIERLRKNISAEYLSALLSKGQSNDGLLTIEDSDLLAIKQIHEPVSVVPEPAAMTVVFNNPVNRWPLWTTAVKLLRQPEDQGVGDTLARTVGPVGGDAYKAWFTKTFGRPCGCTERQVDLNRKYPYEKDKI